AIGSATPITFDFGAIFPFTGVPAYNLPVYASQRPLPRRHARLGTRLLARLCRRRHLRRLSSTRLQGATLVEPDVRRYRIRLSDSFHGVAHVGAFNGRRSRRRSPRSQRRLRRRTVLSRAL